MSRKFFILTAAALFIFVAVVQRERAQEGRIGPPDGIREAIEAKARELNLGSPWSGNIYEYTAIPGGIRGWQQDYDRGSLLYVPGHGVLFMTSAMRSAYRGDPYSRLTHRLGFPIANEFRCLTPDPRDRYQLFEGGTIYWRAAENQYVIEPNAPRPATPGDCPRRGGPVATVVTEPQVPLGRKPPQRHRYRVSIIGFNVTRQTFDGYQEVDGKGDEVYVAAQVTKFNANGEMFSNTGERGVLMGDINLLPVDEERLQAGNLSDQGGIGDGFTYLPARNPSVRYSKPTLPWVVYEGELIQGFDALTVIPSIWEWDNDYYSYQWYQKWAFGLRPGGRPAFFYDPEPGRGRPVPDTRTVGSGWITQIVSESVRSPNGLAPTSSWGEGPVISYPGNPILVNPSGDQPIGANPPNDGDPRRVFVPQILFLTEQLAQRVVRTNFPLPAVRTSNGNTGITAEQFARLGPGVIPVRYHGRDEGMGDYTIFLKVEQVP
jgi:hypothetical protein